MNMQKSYTTIDKAALWVFGYEELFRSAFAYSKPEIAMVCNSLKQSCFKKVFFNRRKKQVSFADDTALYVFNLDPYELYVHFNCIRIIIYDLVSQDRYCKVKGFEGENFIDTSHVDESVLPEIKAMTISEIQSVINNSRSTYITLLRIYGVTNAETLNSVQVRMSGLEIISDSFSDNARHSVEKMHQSFASHFGLSTRWSISHTNGIAAFTDSNKKIASLYAKSKSMVRFEMNYNYSDLPSSNLANADAETIEEFLKPLFELAEKAILQLWSDSKNCTSNDTFEKRYNTLIGILNALNYEWADGLSMLVESGSIEPKYLGNHFKKKLLEYKIIKKCASESGRKRNRRYMLSYRNNKETIDM